jgi:LmbE family N-acetylglucosaminyl deacetylase
MTLTLMAVHAHPDDEVISTGGTLARYGAEGVRTVVVTCTDGSQGFGPEWALPGDPRHDRDAVASLRRQELERSCSTLGVSHLETLGYRDSGMAGWSANDDPGSFCNVPVDDAAAVLAEVIRTYSPQVVITYDDNGGYGHPDHIQAHRVTMEALARSATVLKAYFTARSTTDAQRFADLRLRVRGNRPNSARRAAPTGVPDELITTVIDVTDHLEQKRAALLAHASQLSETLWTTATDGEYVELFGRETFTRAQDRTGAPVPEHDLFVGVR